MGAYSCETAHLFCWNIHLQHHNWTVVQPPFYWCLTFSTCTPYVGSVPTGLCRGHIPRRHSSTFSLHPLLLCRCRTPRTGGSLCGRTCAGRDAGAGVLSLSGESI